MEIKDKNKPATKSELETTKVELRTELKETKAELKQDIQDVKESVDLYHMFRSSGFSVAFHA